MEVEVFLKNSEIKRYSNISWCGREHGCLVLRTNAENPASDEQWVRYKTFYPIEDVDLFITSEPIYND